MFKKRAKKWLVLVGIALFLGVLTFGVIGQIRQLPDNIYLIGENSRVLDVGLPMSMTLKDAAQSSLTVNGEPIGQTGTLQSTLEIAGNADEQAQVEVKLFGMIPIKDISITAVKDKVLVPGGQSIGVMLHTQGALIVGLSDISRENGEACNPAEEAGLKAGDILVEYNGISIENASHLAQLIKQYGTQSVKVTALREGVRTSFVITPVKDAKSNTCKLGAWLRDSTVGVGTLTFYDPESGHLAGLGHAITDYDTGEILTVKEGSILASGIKAVVKGEAGEPGELKGDFSKGNVVLGNIRTNTEYGIYGEAENPLICEKYPYLPAADRSEVTLGEATLLCTVKGMEVQAFSCKLIKLYEHEAQAQRSFIIEIDDTELLETTGGIVQGMSGSPIIQNGKLIGAVTHVFVDNPKRGYGVYIDWMLKDMEAIQ